MRPISSAIIQDPKDPKRQCCETMLISGKVTRDAKIESTKGSDSKPPMPKVTFGIAYEDKKFMNVLAIGDCPQTSTLPLTLCKNFARWQVGANQTRRNEKPGAESARS